ncbi:MAG TPA: FAD-dependent oxidoreductase [Pyrinomonadaceae bacterium]|nr:FAD-dependent oxidoreductase [Pyrinomonadaceae bacterium]
MHDVVILGAGPAGISAALWCDELGLDTLLLEQREEIGGQLHNIHGPILNYPGLPAANGQEFLAKFSERVNDAEFDIWTSVEIENVDVKSKQIFLRSGEILQTIFLIVATGVRRRSLGVPGETEFTDRGIIESPTRDRHEFAGKDVCIVGGGDAAAENALLLAEVCPTVTLVHRNRKLKARREFVEQLQTQHCITVFPESAVIRILGNDRVEAVEILRKDAIKPFQMAVGGVAIRIGVEPNTGFVRDQLNLDKQGYVLVNNNLETSVENVFAIGDVASPHSPTISTASGNGATVAKVIASKLQQKRS